MGCLPCGRFFHDECENGGCENCHEDVEQLVKSFGPRGVGQPIKEDPSDPYSTGRKRAAVKYPLFRTNPCEWQGKKNCGGGTPIVGCFAGKQTDRHHGPIKNPLRNEVGNVHRICKPCHNRWHTINDPIYDELSYSHTRHTPEPAEELELLANEAMWKMKS